MCLGWCLLNTPKWECLLNVMVSCLFWPTLFWCSMSFPLQSGQHEPCQHESTHTEDSALR
uniref:Uncharacterized protein n=1 Tax=Anguilla anguilla TaxID=7936 RepID=A0A0E9XZY8_ANGAN